MAYGEISRDIFHDDGRLIISHGLVHDTSLQFESNLLKKRR